MTGRSAFDSLALPTAAETDGALAEARHLFTRALGSWTSDVLLLRQAGEMDAYGMSEAPAAVRDDTRRRQAA